MERDMGWLRVITPFGDFGSIACGTGVCLALLFLLHTVPMPAAALLLSAGRAGVLMTQAVTDHPARCFDGEQRVAQLLGQRSEQLAAARPVARLAGLLELGGDRDDSAAPTTCAAPLSLCAAAARVGKSPARVGPISRSASTAVSRNFARRVDRSCRRRARPQARPG